MEPENAHLEKEKHLQTTNLSVHVDFRRCNIEDSKSPDTFKHKTLTPSTQFAETAMDVFLIYHSHGKVRYIL